MNIFEKILKTSFFISWLIVWVIGSIPVLVAHLLALPMSIITIIKTFFGTCLYQYGIYITNPKKERKIYFYGDSLEVTEKSNYIFLLNHCSSIDTVTITIISERLGCPTNVRYMSKTFNLLLPISGAMFMLNGFVALSRRNRDKDIQRIKKSIERSVKWNEQIAYILFPEGTRFNLNHSETIQKSIEFQINKFGKSMKNLLAPRITGYKTLINCLGENLDEVFDLTICYKNVNQQNSHVRTSIVDFMWNENIETHVFVKRWSYDKIKELPNDCSYLYEWYFDKDKLIDDFINKFDDFSGKHTEIYSVLTRNYIPYAWTVPFFTFLFIYILGIKKMMSVFTVIAIGGYALQMGIMLTD